MNVAWKHIRRSPYQALTAVFIMTITFFVATILVVLAYSTSTLLHHYETSPLVIAYLKNEATESEILILQQKLESDPRVQNVRFVTKEQALDFYKKDTADKPELSEFLSPKVLPASLEFSVNELPVLEALISDLSGDPIIDEIDFTASLGQSDSLDQVVQRLTKISTYVRLWGGGILTFLLLSSLLVLLVIIGMRISSRRDEIEILQLLGATPGFIRAPFLVEGVFYAIVGAFVGWLAAFLIIIYLYPSLTGFFKTVPFLPEKLLDLFALFGIVLGAEVVLAALLGMTGSFFALRRYLKI